jgi:hypothetical protein
MVGWSAFTTPLLLPLLVPTKEQHYSSASAFLPVLVGTAKKRMPHLEAGQTSKSVTDDSASSAVGQRVASFGRKHVD